MTKETVGFEDGSCLLLECRHLRRHLRYYLLRNLIIHRYRRTRRTRHHLHPFLEYFYVL